MNQLDLIPASRKHDPEGSHLAEESINASGARVKQAECVYQAIRLHPGLTTAELAKRTGMCRYMVARRMPELKKLGKVTDGQKRMCRATGSKSVTTWWPVFDTI